MNLDDYALLKRNKCQMKETSIDDSQKPAVFMVDDTRPVVNFDKVKEQYLADLGLRSIYASSIDALFQDDEETLYFVEFKNGDIEKDNIKSKIADSLLIFCDLTESEISYTRENGTFILVMNDDKYDRLSYRDKRAIGLARLGRQDFALYGIDKLRGYCFKSVSMMTASEFSSMLKKVRIR